MWYPGRVNDDILVPVLILQLISHTLILYPERAAPIEWKRLAVDVGDKVCCGVLDGLVNGLIFTVNIIDRH
jgi:hypothetical protein